MKIIKFTDSEITELRNYYQRELEKTLEKLEAIKGILSKIDTDENKIGEHQVLSEQPVTLKTEENGRTEPAYRTATPKRRKKKISKSKWGTFILDLLRQHSKPIKFDDIVEEAIFKFKIPKERYENVKQSIINSTFRLRNLNKEIRNFKLDGKKGKYLGLSRWFEKNGELKEKYKEKLTPTVTKNPENQKKETRKREPLSKGKTRKTSDNSVWTKFVLSTLKEEDRPILAKTLTEKAMEIFKIDKKLHERTRLAVARSMSRLDKVKKQLKRHDVNGTKPRYYGLAEWFDQNGELSKIYLDKIKHNTFEKRMN